MPGRLDPDSLAATPPVQGLFCPMCRQVYAGGGLRFCPTDGSELLVGNPAAMPQVARESALIGQVLADRYRILRKVGEGGMGEVFEAQHVYIDKRFAVKTLRPEVLTNPEVMARFHQEARAASTIGHENIVEVDDFGRLPDGGVYLAMEYLTGAPLSVRMNGQPPLSREEGLGYVVQACRGLAAAHEKGIVHRDVKPDNIFLAEKGGKIVVKVLDFGIAKVGAASTTGPALTQMGAVFGTPHYMSPEQALGRPLDARSDVYSIGVILFELCTGRVPFDGESFMGILSQHITSPPPRPREVAPDRDIPVALESVILCAMAKQPEERFPSMGALADELANILRGAGDVTLPPVAAKPVPAPVRAPIRVGRSRSGPRMTVEDIRAAEPLELEAPIAAPKPITEEAEIVDEVPAGSGRGKVGLAVVAVALVLAAGIAAFLATRGEPVKAPTDVAPAARVDAASAQVLPPPATAELRPVRLETTPPGAQVLDGDRPLGTTPVTVPMASGGSRTLRLIREGYAPRQVILTTREPTVTIQLEHLPHRGNPSRPHPEPPGFKPAPGEVEPYEALPPPPASKTTPPPSGTPLNPY